MTIPEKIHYIRCRRDWNQKEFGAHLANGGVDQWQTSRWQRGVEKPSRSRSQEIDDVLFNTLEDDFGGGFRYVCNLGESYGHRHSAREKDAVARLRNALLNSPPAAPAGLLNIIVLSADLPEGVRAQCFSSGERQPRSFFVLVRADASWLENAREEIFAHVLSFRPTDNLSTPD
jgi:hypothetical protein